jgi:antitoxin VapB
MEQVARVFMAGDSQAVRLPAGFRFDEKEVFIRRDERTGDLVLSRRPRTWDGFLEALAREPAPEDFLDAGERAQPQGKRGLPAP